MLLALVTALIVARPLVEGEDPGLISGLSSASGLVLSLLWFVAAVAWAAWRAWFRQGKLAANAIEAGLAAVAVAVFVSAFGNAHYKHPAMLIAWEWVVLLIAFGLVRRLARSDADNRTLIAVILATGVSLSAHAVYQYFVELPRDRASLDDPEMLHQELAKLHVFLEPSDPRLDIWKKRLGADNVFATYAHPNSFAGYLALLLPAAIGWAWSCRQQPGWRWQSYLLWSFALLMGIALCLTHSRGAILASLLVAGTALVVQWRQVWWAYKGWVLAGLVAIAGVVALGSNTPWSAEGMSKFWESANKRSDYWIATWKMIRDYPWLGVGPGNFGRHYLRYMLPTASEKVQDPHNLILEAWATSGVFALLALLFALGAFFRQVVASWWHPNASPEATQQSAASSQHLALGGIRWEFYLGGMAGLLLGFLLRVMLQRTAVLSPDAILLEGASSAARSLIWFLAFALLDGLPWPGLGRSLALTTGVAALLLNLLVSGGIGQPSVAQPLWIMAALALNATQLARVGVREDRRAAALPQPHGPAPWHSYTLTLAGSAALGLAYFSLIFYPVAGCAGGLAEAHSHFGDDPSRPGWRNRFLLDWQSAQPSDKLRATNAANQYLRTKILEPLERAVAADPGDAGVRVELALWYGEQWKLFQDMSLSKKALSQANHAQRLDPDSEEAYLVEAHLHKLFAQGSDAGKMSHYEKAAKALRAAAERDPNEAQLRYELAEALFQANNPTAAREQAQVALSLDQHAPAPERRLTPAKREQLQKWLQAD